MRALRPLVAAVVVVTAAVVRAQDVAGIKAFSKYDFVPGARVVALHDFLGDAVGDFPAGWNTNASGEVVTISGKPGHWLMLTKGGVFAPTLSAALPDNFTLEYDLIGSPTSERLSTVIAALSDLRAIAAWQLADNRFTMNADPTGETSTERRQDGTVDANSAQAEAFAAKNGGVVHMSVWRQKERVRVYFNDQKVWDVPQALLPAAKFNSLLFYVYQVGTDDRCYLRLRRTGDCCGFGPDGPKSDQRVYDNVIQASSGLAFSERIACTSSNSPTSADSASCMVLR